jgi:hypothetical protein
MKKKYIFTFIFLILLIPLVKFITSFNKVNTPSENYKKLFTDDSRKYSGYEEYEGIDDSSEITLENIKKIIDSGEDINKLNNGDNILIDALDIYTSYPDSEESLNIIYELLAKGISVDNNKTNPIELALSGYKHGLFEYLNKKEELRELVKALILKTNSIDNFESKIFSPYNIEIFNLLNSKFHLKKENYSIDLFLITEPEYLNILIKQGIVNKKDVDEYTVLFKNKEYFEEYITVSYKIFYKKNKDEKTRIPRLIKIFSYSSKEKAISILNNHKDLNLELEDSQGNTLIFYLIKNLNYNLIDYFNKKEMNIKKQNIYGISPLMYAAMENDISAIQILQNKENTLELKDKKGFTALSWAVYLDNFIAVDYLIKIGADKNVKDIHGYSLIKISNSKTMKKHLREYGLK